MSRRRVIAILIVVALAGLLVVLKPGAQLAEDEAHIGAPQGPVATAPAPPTTILPSVFPVLSAGYGRTQIFASGVRAGSFVGDIKSATPVQVDFACRGDSTAQVSLLPDQGSIHVLCDGTPTAMSPDLPGVPTSLVVDVSPGTRWEALVSRARS